MKTSATLGG